MTAAPKPQVRQTKLAFRLRKLCETTGDNPRMNLFLQAAADLDRAAYSLGAKGERVKQLSAYFTCLRYYQELAGEPYAD